MVFLNDTFFTSIQERVKVFDKRLNSKNNIPCPFRIIQIGIRLLLRPSYPLVYFLIILSDAQSRISGFRFIGVGWKKKIRVGKN